MKNIMLLSFLSLYQLTAKDKSVATVDKNGLVKTKTKGHSTITVTVDKTKSEIEIYVY